MAISATIAAENPVTNAAGLVVGFTALCTVSNSGEDSVNVTSIESYLTKPRAAAAIGLPPVGPGLAVDVPASGSRAFRWGVVAYAPFDSESSSDSNSFSVLATVTTSDGSVVEAVED